MATITGLTAARMLEIEGASVVDGEIVANHLILTKHDGTTVDAGLLPPGPTGPAGPSGGQIPGEIRAWSGSVLPSLATYGKWVWADGAVYLVATYPLAAANIATQWRTAHGQSDPGGANFRVPDLRGMTLAGLDQMPGGARANRITRSVSIIIAGKGGEEVHTITVPEMPAHTHTETGGGHTHSIGLETSFGPGSHPTNITPVNLGTGNTQANVTTSGPSAGVVLGNTGGGSSHENMQPTIFVPYIVKLD